MHAHKLLIPGCPRESENKKQVGSVVFSKTGQTEFGQEWNLPNEQVTQGNGEILIRLIFLLIPLCDDWLLGRSGRRDFLQLGSSLC